MEDCAVRLHQAGDRRLYLVCKKSPAPLLSDDASAVQSGQGAKPVGEQPGRPVSSESHVPKNAGRLNDHAFLLQYREFSAFIPFTESNMPTFFRSTNMPVPADFLFRYHAQPGAFQRLTPPWENVEVAEMSDGIQDGARVKINVGVLGPIKKAWVAEHREYQEGESFQDVQLEGPFARWEHTHRMHPVTDSASMLEDEIEYQLPLGAVGSTFGGGMVRRKLERMFAYRHRVTSDDVAAHYRYYNADKENNTMKVLISGRGGLVGGSLEPFLTTGGHTTAGLTRSAEKPDDVAWSPSKGEIDTAKLAEINADAVVHLAGESIVGRWTSSKKERILQSRTEGTTLLCQALADLDHKPKTLVCASAIGIYGDRGDLVLTEESEPGDGFLPDVCREWEAACQPARDAGIRVVNLRIGVVLSPNGGALAKMLLPFKMGAGGKIGSGKQWWSWIALDDVVGLIHHALMNDELTGPVNATAPQPMTNYDFTKTLGKVLGRPTIFPMPGFMAKLALGQMADDLLLASARVEPQKAIETHYEFRFPELAGALRHLLGKPA